MSQTPDPLAHRLTQLEIKACYSEDLLDQLNQTVFAQQQQIDRLLREVQQLRSQQDHAQHAEPRGALDERPPHY